MNFSTSSCIQEFKIWASGLGKESNDDKYEIELTWRVRSRADLNHSADWVSPTDPSKLTRDFQIFVDPVRGFIFLGSCPNRSEVWFFAGPGPIRDFIFPGPGLIGFCPLIPDLFIATDNFCWNYQAKVAVLYSLSTDIFRQTIWSLSETNLSSHFLTWKNLKVFQRWQN